MKRPKGKGRIWRRGEQGFDKAVLATSFNARDSGARPDLLVEANSAEDVQSALLQAREKGWQVSIVSGGHSWAQNHLREGGLLLSMARINQIEIDPQAGIAKVGPGCWGLDLDCALKKHKLFFPIAHAPDVALGGFLLQGGFGWGSRDLGLATQSVIGIDLVLADGSRIHASKSENADIFWAARGSGPGFFAVVLRYHLRLHPRPKFTGMKVQVFRQEHLDDVFRWADDVGASVARSVEFQMLITPKAMGIFKPGIEVFAPVLANSWKKAREAVRFINDSPIRKLASFTTPLIPSSTSILSQTANITHFPPDVRWCADNIWTDAPIDDLLHGLNAIADTMPPAPSHALWLNWHPPRERPDMAFSLEANRYLAAYGEWKHAADDHKYENWATERMTAMQDHAVGIQLADENLGKRPARFMKDENLARLDSLRAKYDPSGMFRPWMGRPDQAN
ncbi:FAD-binding oxidoreductase [uncultured Erythrobacter sp.]|uniref:FAD-binding oxidoreductase n=1 Tax=uncultured Erythrobacter sp. TaxID=263913 RepID=UPI0026118A24|nr:FAD-binding oxidoreductase [uncultured Erythrobacter sp.]